MPANALLLIPQSPFDSASGAAISERATCEMLASAGWRVRVVATTGTERPFPVDHGPILNALGIRWKQGRLTHHPNSILLLFSHRSVSYTLLDTGSCTINEARLRFAREIDSALEDELQSCIPELVITFGSSPHERDRRKRLQAVGAKILFSIHNLAYTSPEAFEHLDAIVTPSRYATRHYEATHGVSSIPLPIPVNCAEVIAANRNPVFCTLVNPSPIKGIDFFLKVVERCAQTLPAISFLTVESRGSTDTLRRALARTGVNAASLPNLSYTANTQNAASFYAVTRVLLVPSYTEASGRVVVEAQLNGIPVVTSDRGGLPETLNGGGFSLPVSGDVGPIDPEMVETWVEVLGKLWHNQQELYREACARARAATVRHTDGSVESERVAILDQIATGPLSSTLYPTVR